MLGIFVVSRNPKNTLCRAWFYFCCSVGTWSLGYSLTMSPDIFKDVALVCSRVSHASGALIPALFLRYVLIWLGVEHKHRRLLLACFLNCGILAVLSLTPLIVIDVVPKLFFRSYPRGSIGYVLYIVTFVWWVILAHFYMIRSYSHLHGLKRNQMKYFLLGTILGYFGGATCFPLIFNIQIPPYPTVLILVYVFTTTYAIIRFRLLDINIIITRGVVFIVVYTTVLGIPFWAGYRLLGRGPWMIPALIMMALATTGPYLYLFIQRRAEDRLLRGQRRYQKLLIRASRGMTRVRELGHLSNLIVHVMSKAIGVTHCAVYLLNKEKNIYEIKSTRSSNHHLELALPQNLSVDDEVVHFLISEREPIISEEVRDRFRHEPNDILSAIYTQMHNMGSAVIIPSLIEDELLGFVVLGDKISGAIYTQDDLSVFSVLANQAALAIENAQFYEELERTQTELFHSSKMASLGTLASGMSHQINNRFNALTMIAGATLDRLRRLDRKKFSKKEIEALEKTIHALERVEVNSIQGSEVVKALLNYSRPAPKKLEIISVKNLIDNTISLLQYKIDLSTINIVSEISDKLPPIRVNPSQIQDVFFNLIDNAYDATKEKGDKKGTITISARVKDDNAVMEIRIKDTGVGMTDEELSHIFTPYFTTKATGSKGTGLGLFVIQKIVTLHGGTIRPYSKQGEGSTFVVELPIVKEA